MKTAQATLTESTKEAGEYKIILDFIIGQAYMIDVRRASMLNILLLALTNDENPISHQEGKASEYERLLSFMDMLRVFINEIKINEDDLSTHAKEILDNAFLLDNENPGETSYMHECRTVLNNLMLAVLRNTRVVRGNPGYEDMINFFDALNTLINDVENLYVTASIRSSKLKLSCKN